MRLTNWSLRLKKKLKSFMLMMKRTTFRHSKQLLEESIRFFLAIGAKEARELLKTEEIDLIITDQRMPEETGVEFLESIIPIYPKPIRLLLTGYTDIQAVIDAINKGKVYHYLTEPWEEEYLRTVIKNSFDIYTLRSENERLTQALIKSNEQMEFLLRQSLLS